MKLLCGICGMNQVIELAFDGPDRKGSCDFCGEEDNLYLVLGRTDSAIEDMVLNHQLNEILESPSYE